MLLGGEDGAEAREVGDAVVEDGDGGVEEREGGAEGGDGGSEGGHNVSALDKGGVQGAEVIIVVWAVGNRGGDKRVLNY